MEKMLKTTAKDRVTKTAEHVNGGAGFIMKEELITPEHHGEAEMYYILEGTGMYEEDGEAVAVEAGDVTYCEDGHGHGLKNNGKEELVMVAVILKK